MIFDQKTKTIEGGYMNILADNLNESNKEVYYKKAGNFSGKIQYFGISGKYLNGWVYSLGKINKTISMRGLELTVEAKTETSNCSVTATPRYGTVCAGEGNDNCFTSIVGYDYTTTCNSINPNDGSGGGGGGGMIGGGGGSGIHGPGPKPKGVTSDHGLIGKGSLPPNNTSHTQVGATCVFATIEWVSKFFGGDVTTGSAISDYAVTYNIDGAALVLVITTQGVDPSQVPEMVNKIQSQVNM